MAILRRSRLLELLARISIASRCLVSIAAFMLAGLGNAAAPTEYEVKAVFLFNFAHFIEWPAAAFPDPQTPFVICVLGRDPFGDALDETVRGETIDGRTFAVERFSNLAGQKACQILFIDRSAETQAQEVLSTLKGSSTLTVNDAEASMPMDVAIGFVNENKKIRLRINVDSARNAGLKISSKLLRPAQIIGTSTEG